MTAEIGILNRQGVALAADSAVTITQGRKLKVLNTANKLFNLSDYEPVGIMIYGNGSYINTPWDIIIKEYRKKLGVNKFNSLKDYADDFFKFLFDYKAINTDKIQEHLVTTLFGERFDRILNIVNEYLYSKYEGSKPPEDDVKSVLKKEILRYHDEMLTYEDLENVIDFPYEEYDRIYSNKIINIIDSIVHIKLDDDSKSLLKKIGYYSITKNSFLNYTGVVIAGYGEKEIFPSIYEYHISGLIRNFKRYKINDREVINIEDNNTARIMPFAQQEMVHAVVKGIDPYLDNKINEIIHTLTLGIGDIIKSIITQYKLDIDYEKNKEYFNEAGGIIYKEIKQYINDLTIEKFINPILDMVEMLPKDELATMAETLVNLTSFKRRITIDEETVGGPVDVAVISKTDGFIWIKRKHYFDSEINYNYFNRKKEAVNYVYQQQ